MKAQNKCKVNSKNSREKGFIREDFYAYVKKLVYVLVTTTEVVIYEFLDIIWIIAIIKDSCYYGYSQDPSPPKEESLSIEDNNAQEAKEIKPEQSESNLNVKEELSNEPWDVTASGDNNVIAKRARMNRSTDLEKKGRKGSSNEESDNKTKTVRNKKAHTFVLERLGKYYDKSTNTYNGIIKVLRNTEFLQLCYLEIKSKLGNMTKGLDRTTLDSISMKTFENLSKSIMNGSFDFKLARRHMILKKDGSLRLLGISSLIEKIVHKGLQVILDIPHDVIMDSLRNHIKCDKFLIVINKLLKAGYKNLVTGKIMKSNMGTLQGSVVSPMLANIVLDRFDKIVKYSIMLEYTKGKRRKSNPEYDKLISIRYSRTKGLLHTLEARQALLDMRKIPRYQTNDLNFRRSMYIRYADDFVFLLAGLYKEALEIKSKLADILKVECGLELNEKKTLVTHLSKGFEFLGANIKKLKYDNEPIFVSHTKNGKLVKQRRAVRLRLNVLFKKLINRLIDNKFIRRNHLNKIYATLKDSVILLSHDRIVEFFNQK
ncbi:Putative COX1/OXI3 intron 1 protein [Wickerhamiella sorbophila]|uniref:COX1/OXI3 intron 1 protein n=1 Tax=Wickerhamiella sorbophila TaxID=45607 RepID=A0A2T0FGT3_9ASCO|nr:Putative COX1/OXI3 intron 1 protein [Wickerhamiella sorbophila]XP_024664120.1 Putative COX1/OXI3 intron 1 protein [Wickerhamiella sorbophila]XP_024664124.1 Putative COX1/OXI3 intron 1 protein [Wickerhamiella sorbophila]XP_024664144.1 Putative COX1/OXI3 intron 1 protein [Wickerhamiella sorbophila]XP_024664146.1 Putative COX1/OXI3 intron 1 protein [Wickerhamiella sorbophila]XP_024664149.1 Putative COX1/OXI3 intron 1 protein [Wickerhamiella sorbophila]PRT54170.1 Putative COX1/OXI3 intron 1 pr